MFLCDWIFGFTDIRKDGDGKCTMLFYNIEMIACKSK